VNLSARLKRLEAAAHERGSPCAVTYRLGETPADALRRACAAGASGGALLVCELLSPEEWLPLAREQQAALVRDSHEALH
jgi:hypothetical protein